MQVGFKAAHFAHQARDFLEKRNIKSHYSTFKPAVKALDQQLEIKNRIRSDKIAEVSLTKELKEMKNPKATQQHRLTM